MSSALVGRSGSAGFGDRLLAAIAEQGSESHPYPTSAGLLRGPEAGRNLSDAVHFLCMLHGRRPGVIDHAANHCLTPSGRVWFAEATDSFAAERLFLTRLAVAAGPIPGTPGNAGTEATVASQRHALELLAQSERKGCALGAAVALAIDWWAIRDVLDVAAQRFGLELPVRRFDHRHDVAAFAAIEASSPAMERAMMFGAEQVSVQHFGLWDLLEARQQARTA